jgi:hypothetical protein
LRRRLHLAAQLLRRPRHGLLLLLLQRLRTTILLR